jgi:hypothetical protein
MKISTALRRAAAAPLLLSVPFAIVSPQIAQACASCGCTLSSDAAMGYSADAGWRINIQNDYLHQDELRSGTRSVNGVPEGNELERETLNRYITTGISYSPNARWSVNLLVPYVMRTHSTYGEFDSTEELPALTTSRSSSLGDIKLIASYQGILPTHNLGIQLGVKLPTGRYGDSVKFNAGPDQGEPLDASLQPGTGSTDVIVGAYYYRAISQNFDMFANGQFQSAVKHRVDEPDNDFRPGNSTTLNLGVRYAGSPRWQPQLQVNLLHKSRDQGALADIESTAGNVAYLSPGLTAKVLPRVQMFGFFQVPVYSNLYGYQLFPRWTASVGASYAF